MNRQDLRVFLQGWQCGCGSPETSVRFVYDILKTIDTRWKQSHPLSIFHASDRPALDAIWKEHRGAMKALLPTEGIEYFVLYVLTEWDLLEHGGSVGGSWLTDKGKDVLAALESETSDEFAQLCVGSCVHGYAMGMGDDDYEDCPECGKLNASH